MKSTGRLSFSLLLFLFSFAQVSAQDLTGIWKGYFVTEDGDQYRLEFQIAQSTTLTVQGVSYSFLDTRFYGKAMMTGNFDPKAKTFNIQELRTTEVKQQGIGNSTCLMNYQFVFSRSGKELFLEGTYMGRTENRKNPEFNGKWGSCGGGTVRLRRVEESDFYVEPFVKESIAAKKAAPKNGTTTRPQTPPVARTTPKVTPKPPVTPPRQTPKEPAIQRPVTNLPHEQVVTEAPKIKPKILPMPAQTRGRENELAKLFVVTNQEITIKLYDNGEVDNDTVSVYLDDHAILSNKRLTAAPITFTVKLDEQVPEHTLIMVAENMGRIPPNTSLMVVFDGTKRYQVNITSTEQKNAMVRLRYQNPAP